MRVLPELGCTTKKRSQLLLEEFVSDGNLIGNDSETEESAESDKEKIKSSNIIIAVQS